MLLDSIFLIFLIDLRLYPCRHQPGSWPFTIYNKYWFQKQYNIVVND